MDTSTDFHCNDTQMNMLQNSDLRRNESKTRWVVVITLLTMGVEIVAGYLTHSMALFADGWHMGSHAAALIISLVAYRLARNPSINRNFTFGAGKMIPLGGFTSALILSMIAVLVVFESIQRLLHPQLIDFNEAIGVACIGLIVNVTSALILHHSHGHEDHDHDHGHDHADHDHHHSHTHDLNFKSAFIHVIADAVTSMLAIIALFVAKHWSVIWLDAAIGIVGSFVIFSWGYQLIRQTGWELLDGHSSVISRTAIRKVIEGEHAKVCDLHVWRIAPNAIACELVVNTTKLMGAQFYRAVLLEQFHIQHLIIEENLVSKS